jgi:UDP-N-acetylmuramyl tripeptide synthase
MFVHVDRPALIVINDRIADGRDVSWLWDVDVEPLRARPSLFCSGTRGYDMALRLKYADLPAGASIDTISAINSFIDQGGGVVFLTYTAMLDVRRYLTKLRKVSKK